MRIARSEVARDVVLFDGRCVFCRGSVERLRRWVPDRSIDYRSFRDPGALDSFPGLSMQTCEQAMQLVRADGEVFAGMEAVVQVLRRRAVGRLALAYYLPGFRQLADLGYALVAKNRMRIAGAACEDGTCGVHHRGDRPLAATSDRSTGIPT